MKDKQSKQVKKEVKFRTVTMYLKQEEIEKVDKILEGIKRENLGLEVPRSTVCAAMFRYGLENWQKII